MSEDHPATSRNIHHSCSIIRLRAQAEEGGWALLGLILALTIIGITLTAIAPNVKMEVQRDKEQEMIYRGQQMAEAIGRYYNGGRSFGPMQLMVPPPYGYLTELKKLKEGVLIGANEVKFVRAAMMIDPMTSLEWEPVRARDPRIAPVLQAYAAETGNPIPPQLWLIAGPPVKLHKIAPSTPPLTPGQNNPPQPTPAPGQGGAIGNSKSPGAQNPDDQDDNDDDTGDDDDDDDDDINDPLRSLFEPGKGNIPIVGVAPRIKGPSVRALYGLTNYEEWVFIYIPQTQQQVLRPGVAPNPNPGGRVNR